MTPTTHRNEGRDRREHPTLWQMVVITVVASIAVAIGGATGVASATPTEATTWLCRPGQAADPCGGRSGAPVDCFYVYPTVSLQLTANANRAVGPEERLIAGQQAEPFGANCNVWAPIYRQSTLRGLFTATGNQRATALDLAYDDLEKGWNDYLAHHNNGRGVVLIGHSQGTLMLRTLIRKRIENTPVQARLVSAILLGGNVLVRKGSLAGGDFSSVPACTTASQNGCVIAYSAFNRQPPADSRFGRPPSEAGTQGARGDLPFGPDYEVLCTNPAALGSGAPARLHSEIAGRSARGYTGVCSTDGGAHVLRISGGGNGAPPAGALPTLPNATWGLHLLDVNLAQGDLVDLVGTQARAYIGR
ncbi:DUF3089 domain-containing protein [Williamsia phyllosphaerae]|uniref:Lysophospholipase n=1 Tax=Williamsia phyllosphaerae TaxID=885042 RepID=A0ABQ1UES5_9NOCA|nr:DUF3089 domain-containing protein [Williamsia phyllosphaerae]GGF17432.1 lysophospholipase [Williamsia phyllosphaerae]